MLFGVSGLLLLILLLCLVLVAWGSGAGLGLGFVPCSLVAGAPAGGGGGALFVCGLGGGLVFGGGLASLGFSLLACSACFCCAPIYLTPELTLYFGPLVFPMSFSSFCSCFSLMLELSASETGLVGILSAVP